MMNKKTINKQCDTRDEDGLLDYLCLLSSTDDQIGNCYCGNGNDDYLEKIK